MIPARYSGFVALLGTSIVMSCIVSGVSTALPLVQRIVGKLSRT
jgi:hypothetical protein